MIRPFSRSSAAPSSGPRTSGSRRVTLALAIALAFGLLFATRQITPGHWYANEYVYRAQVDALLAGRLALSHAPDALYHDLAWTPGGGVQQVWGLGVPILQAPFEVIGRVIGVTPFPDRIAMAAFLALAFFVLLRAVPGWRGVGALLVTALLPPIITMLRCRFQVYEDAALYAYLAALILLGGLVIFERAPTRGRYLLLLAVAGATGLIRPTVWFYGLGTAIAATVIWWRAGGHRWIAAGALLFVLGGGALYATNAIRFGQGTEFGHRLNVESLPGNLTATRFSYPFERVGAVEAAEELVGSLFDRPETNKRGFYHKQLHRGVSEVPRWREYYFTTYAWPYVPLLVAGLVLGALALRRRDRLGVVLLGWAMIGAAPLFVFYLHSPSVSSRYQLDFAPAFAALLLLGWRELAARVAARIALPIAFALWALAVVTAHVHRPARGSDPQDQEEALDSYDVSRALPELHADRDGLDLDDPLLPIATESEKSFERCLDESGARIACAAQPVGGDLRYQGIEIDRQWYVTETAIEERAACGEATIVESTPAVFAPLPVYYLDAFGWRIDGDGNVPVATCFYVTDPRFFEIESYGGDPTKIRVAIGLQHLAPVAFASTARGTRVRFEVRDPLPPGVSVAFVAFGDDAHLDLERSSYQVVAVRWR